MTNSILDNLLYYWDKLNNDVLKINNLGRINFYNLRVYNVKFLVKILKRQSYSYSSILNDDVHILYRKLVKYQDLINIITKKDN